MMLDGGSARLTQRQNHTGLAAHPNLSKIGNGEPSLVSLLPDNLPPGRIGIGEGIEPAPALELGEARFLPGLDPPEEEFIGAIHPAHCLLQSMAVKRDQVGSGFLYGRQFVLLLVVREGYATLPVGIPPLQKGRVIEFPVQVQPVGKRLLLSLGRAQSENDIANRFAHDLPSLFLHHQGL